MSYGFDEKTGTGLQMPAGINENVILQSVTVEEREDHSSLILRFKFVDPEGRIFTYAEFPVNDKDIPMRAKAFKMTPQALIEQDQRDQGERLKHILSIFTPVPKIKAESWDDFLQQLEEEIKDVDFAATPVRIKVSYNKKNFLIFPKRPIKPFIQKMTDPNTLELTKYDIVIPYDLSKAKATEGKTGFGVQGEVPTDMPDYNAQGLSAFDDTLNPDPENEDFKEAVEELAEF